MITRFTLAVWIFTINDMHIFFQEFDDYRDADDAVYELNGKELLGERWVSHGQSFSTL